MECAQQSLPPSGMSWLVCVLDFGDDTKKRILKNPLTRYGWVNAIGLVLLRLTANSSRRNGINAALLVLANSRYEFSLKGTIASHPQSEGGRIALTRSSAQ